MSTSPMRALPPELTYDQRKGVAIWLYGLTLQELVQIDDDSDGSRYDSDSVCEFLDILDSSLLIPQILDRGFSLVARADEDVREETAILCVVEAFERLPGSLSATVEEGAVRVEEWNGGSHWLVVNERETKELVEITLDSILEDCVLSELEGVALKYFDKETWKEDNRHDGAACILGAYTEEEVFRCGYWRVFEF